jgi:hypothetical protein
MWALSSWQQAWFCSGLDYSENRREILHSMHPPTDHLGQARNPVSRDGNSAHEIARALWSFAASPVRRTEPGETPMKRLKARLKAASD